MICLTGDIHHQSLGTGNQKYADQPEIAIARKYLALLESVQIKVTFFISGKAFHEEWNRDLQEICQHPLVEIGGHNYSCFTPPLWHRLSKKLFRSYNGPRWYQKRDTEKTIAIIQERTGKRIRFWRNHMYMHGPFTDEVLSASGIFMCSDGVSAQIREPLWHPKGLYHFPLNILPDHEHLYHAERTPEWVKWWVKRYQWSDDFGSESYEIEEWTDRVLEALKKNEERQTISNMIIHPITLYLADRFKSLPRILDFLAQHQTLHYSELYLWAEKKRKDQEEALSCKPSSKP
jgi:peptidoglycan/xylan/chitin deacetylase (PgdA/CDA1 family)